MSGAHESQKGSHLDKASFSMKIFGPGGGDVDKFTAFGGVFNRADWELLRSMMQYFLGEGLVYH